MRHPHILLILLDTYFLSTGIIGQSVSVIQEYLGHPNNSDLVRMYVRLTEFNSKGVCGFYIVTSRFTWRRGSPA